MEGNSDNAIIPEDEIKIPDILDVNLPDWDLAWPALFHAIATGSISAIDELIVAGANVSLASRFTNGYQKTSVHPLTAVVLTKEDSRAEQIISRLVKAGAVSTAADENVVSIFQRLVMSGRASLVAAILNTDSKAKIALNFPGVVSNTAVFPLLFGLQSGSYAVTATLLTHGAKLQYSEEDLSRVRDTQSVHSDHLVLSFKLTDSALSIPNRTRSWRLDDDYLKSVVMPLENAIARQDPIVHLLIALGADINLAVRLGLVYDWNKDYAEGTYLDWVRNGIQKIDADVSRLQSQSSTTAALEEPSDLDLGSEEDWKKYAAETANELARTRFVQAAASRANPLTYPNTYKNNKQERDMIRHKKYLLELEALLVSLNARSGIEIRVEKLRKETAEIKTAIEPPYHYLRDAAGYQITRKVNPSSVPFYDELFQAVWDGNHGKIQELCLPKEGSKREPLQITIQLITTNGATCMCFLFHTQNIKSIFFSHTS